MFFKSEKKKSHAPFFIAVGALAVIGAASIIKCGKELVCCMMPVTVESEEENN
ncbi:MAG: hypothetical protein IKY62_03350 [Clostridia bacterium]|jgi:hypothetical protein|nr:hypothetical protein [Clostridia bacterium]